MPTPREYLDSIIMLANDIRNDLDEFIELNAGSDDDAQLDLLQDVDEKLSDVANYIAEKLEELQPDDN